MRRPPAALAALALTLFCLGSRARADPQVDRALRALESSPSTKARSQAALVLGQLRAAEAASALRQAASADGAPVVRIAAVSALVKLGVAEARATLEAVLRADPDHSVREAARGALAELAVPAAPAGRASPGATTVSLDDTVRTGGGPADRQALRTALGRRLQEAGFRVQGDGGLRIKPSIVKLDAERAGEKTVVAIRAELVAVEVGGRMAAMLEGGARLSAAGALGEGVLAAISRRAVDVVAKVLADDLAARLGER
jgi:hypothetical protein